MDYSVLVWPLQALLGAFCTVLWFNFVEVRRDAKKANDELANYKVFVAERYATAEDLREAINAITRTIESYSTKLDARFDRLEQKLDRKVDKD